MFALDCWFLHGYNLAGLKGNIGDLNLSRENPKLSPQLLST